MPLYVCTLHPDVQRNHPDTCSKCGKKLEPREIGPTVTSARTGKKQPIRER